MAEEKAEGLERYEADREQVRAAAKWFIAALGAIGAVLVAGSQLSSVGSLPSGSRRLYVAIVGVVVGLLAILWAMWKVVDVLGGTRWTLDDLAREWTAVKGQGRFRRLRHPVGDYFRTHPSQLGNFTSVPEIKKLFDDSEPGRKGLDDLRTLIDKLTDEAKLVDLQARFRLLRWQVSAAVVVAAAGVIAFAWAANPEKPEQPAPSLRNSRLVGADLSGANLRNADLTGADLTGADLHGADLRGATIEGVVWSGTTCPDGSNSDDRTRVDKDGKTAGGTCAGHLAP